MAQALQVTFHGISRSEAVEAAIAKELAALGKFDHNLGPCHATVTQEGHQCKRSVKCLKPYVAM